MRAMKPNLTLAIANKAQEVLRDPFYESLDYSTPSERAMVFEAAGIAFDPTAGLAEYMRAKCELGGMLSKARVGKEIMAITGAKTGEEAISIVNEWIAKERK